MNRIYAKNKSKIISFIAFTLILILTQSLNARNFYFSASTGDDNRTSTQAQNPATPWKSISKLNSFFVSLTAGDSVLFRRGESFYGSIRILNSGSSSLPIVIGAYGTGVAPIITGFTSITTWTSIGNGVYQSAVTNCKPTLNIVTINKKNTPMGRYPNTGFLSFESHSGNTSITDNQLLGTPNWTGSEVIIRKAKYAIGRNLISNHTNGTITYLGGGDAPIDNFGYFIQNDLKTLDIFGEWYLNPSTSRLNIYSGATNPSSYSIKASTLDTLVYSSYQSYVTITGLNFEGANYSSFYIRGGQNIAVVNCGIDFSGKFGVNASGNTGFKLENCSINHSNHNSVQLFCSNAVVRNNKIKNTGLIPGMAENGEGGNGIELLGGDGTLIEYNDIDSVAGHGIFIRGNNVTIKNNLVNHFAFLLDDVGGIYTYGKFTGRKIIGNIVLNGVGSIAGTTSTIAGVKGIMMEVFSAFVEIRDNTVSNAGVSGIHLNSSHDLIIRNNVIYNNRYQILSQNSATDPAEFTRNISMYKNIFFSKSATQNVMYMYSIRTDIPLFGTADSNYYCRPLDDNYAFLTIAASVQTGRTLAGWQSYSLQDSHSKKSPQTLTSENDILFDYNASQANKVIPLNAVYLGVDGTVYTSSYTLLPYKSVILIKSANQTIGTNLPPFIQNQSFQVNKTTTNGTVVGTVIASDPNVGQLLTYSIISGNTNSAFTLNSSTGVLSVANATEIAAQTLSSYSLVVRVQDNGTGLLSSQATITVSLTTTVNQPPVINNQSFSAAQNQANGTSVGTVIATDPDASQTKTFSIVSGNTSGAFAIGAATGVLTVANSAALDYAITPSFALIVRVQDNGTGLLSSQATITINVVPVTLGCSATGNISYQVWNNIGTSVSVSALTSNINYPNNPSSTTLITSMEGTTNLADEFGARIAGYICAPATGSYTFWIASDDYGELWLSTDNQPANKQKIAYHNGYTWIREWNKYPTQKSVAINLIQGQTYYIEALMKDASGGDNLSVGWLKPGQSGTVPSEVIPGSVLSPLGSIISVPVSSVSLPSTASINIGANIVLQATILPTNASNSTLNWTSSNPGVATVNSSGLVTGISTGTVTITAKSTDGSNISDICLVTVNSQICSATGNITYQIWNNIGTSVSVSALTSNINYPDNPSSTTLITSMEGTTNLADEFGARIAGYICAPATGSYTFWIASDDYGELWLSTDNQPANKQKIAYHNGYTWIREWNKYPTQKSVAINLIQGNSYYIEALMKDASGGDNLAVGWLRPGQSGTVPSEIIPGSVLSPIAASVTVLVSSVSLPSTSTVDVGSSNLITATVLPANASNSTLTWTSSNPIIATVDNNGFVTGITSGTVTITATANDGSGKSDNCLVTVNSQACSATGNITYQVWNNIGSSTSVSSLTSNTNYPNNPTTTSLITSMEGPTNQADMYGARIAGYICAPATGSYTFWIASDNDGELWLSLDDKPTNKQKIAYVTGATLPRAWNSYASQKSVSINLVQGEKYYIEALMKEAYGGDCLAVGWLKPGQTGAVPSEIIPGSVLSPIVISSIVPVSSVSLPSSSSLNVGSNLLLQATVLPANATVVDLNWISSNPAVVTVNTSGLITGVSAGTATITATATDGSSKSANCLVTVNSPACSATGNITYQVWNNIGSSTSVSSLTTNSNYPDNPTTSTLITSMEGLTNQADMYGARIAGYICAPETGSYTFWIASDNEGELWLSTDDQEINKQKIAYVSGATLPRAWNSYSSQKSISINLVQGVKYYIEALMKEAYGGDCLAVGWLKPGQTGLVPSEVIPGTVLSPIGAAVSVLVSSVSIPASSSVNVGSTVLLPATVLPANSSINSLAWTSSNPAVATVDNNGYVTGIAAGTSTITATSTDGSNKTGNCLVTVNSPVCSATGNISYQVWNNIGSSTSVSSLTTNVNYPNNPTSTSLITSMEGTTNLADGYGARIAGYICAPATGNYTFWIASDDYGELWLSTDDQPANVQKIAYHNGYTWIREWNKYPTQKSVVITLTQGKSYYIEALMKDAGGNDNLAVGWLKPGQTGTVPSEVIPGSVLSPLNNKSKEVNINSITQSISDPVLSVYPNPLSNGELNVKIENLTSQATLKIYTITGIELSTQIVQSSGTILIDKSIFSKGMYLVKIYNQDFVKSTKLIVN